MAPEPLTAERVLEATEEVLRRYGPAKATVVDVARVLGVSHGSVYRHFRTKTALREAVTERWLQRTTDQLVVTAQGSGPAPDRLSDWLTGLFELKRAKAGQEPEMFATFGVLIGESSEIVERHLARLADHLTRIIKDGLARGEFVLPAGMQVRTAARAVLHATSRYHDPAHAAHWSDPGAGEEFAAVRDLVLRSLIR
jgi:AcrR family transcriptional regulator